MKTQLALLVPLVAVLAVSCNKPSASKSASAPATKPATKPAAAAAHPAATTAATPAAKQAAGTLDAMAGPPKPQTIPAPADVAAPPAGARHTKSGLAYKVLTRGTGHEHPTADDIVKVHYTGWTTDGKMFDSSVVRGRPATFPLRNVIPGWTEGVQLMVVGEKTRFWIPEALAYKGLPGRPKGMLVFDVQLLDILKKPVAPKDVAGPPKHAKKTASGLAYEVLKKGTGKVHPGPRSVVEVHYSGWTTDGKMFDSSIMRGQPATFPLDRVIPGWTEGLQLMVVGEKTRFWIPAKLAYAGHQGAPQGTLVFDVQLLKIIRQ